MRSFSECACVYVRVCSMHGIYVYLGREPEVFYILRCDRNDSYNYLYINVYSIRGIQQKVLSVEY